MHITGACHCRAIRYEADVLATSVSICHCSDCQILTGAAFRISIPAAEGSFRFIFAALRRDLDIRASGDSPSLSGGLRG